MLAYGQKIDLNVILFDLFKKNRMLIDGFGPKIDLNMTLLLTC